MTTALKVKVLYLHDFGNSGVRRTWGGDVSCHVGRLPCLRSVPLRQQTCCEGIIAPGSKWGGKSFFQTTSRTYTNLKGQILN